MGARCVLAYGVRNDVWTTLLLRVCSALQKQRMNERQEKSYDFVLCRSLSLYNRAVPYKRAVANESYTESLYPPIAPSALSRWPAFLHIKRSSELRSENARPYVFKRDGQTGISGHGRHISGRALLPESKTAIIKSRYQRRLV